MAHCERCSGDYPFWEMVPTRMKAFGYRGEIYSKKRSVCPTCFEIYARIDADVIKYMMTHPKATVRKL